MRRVESMCLKFLWVGVVIVFFTPKAVAGGNSNYYGEEDPNKKVLKSGLLGAATGAIASGASGGKAGKGALIGAGTNVIGGALLDTLTAPSQPRQPAYATGYAAPPPPPPTYQGYSPGYGDPAPPQPVYYTAPPPQVPYEDPNKKILKAGLLGAGTGAIASSVSGGKAGTGALVGAGTNVIGGALLDSLMSPSRPQQGYYQQAPPPQPYYQSYPQQPPQPQKKIIRKYDAQGNIIEEQEVYQ